VFYISANVAQIERYLTLIFKPESEKLFEAFSKVEILIFFASETKKISKLKVSELILRSKRAFY
jgi:hypothetical protein